MTHEVLGMRTLKKMDFGLPPTVRMMEIFYHMGQSGDANDDPIRGARGLPEVSDSENDEQTS